MVRIAGVNLEDNWKIDYALTQVKGIGWSRSKDILSELGLDMGARVSELSSSEVKQIAAKLEDYAIEGDLVRKGREDISRLKAVGTYRGLRHAKGLPIRGQRTRSNARTKRGKRRTVGAYKKDALTKMAAAKKGES